MNIQMNIHKKQDLGLKCSAWKVFGSGSNDFGLVGLYHKTRSFWVKKKFGSENFLTPKNLGFCVQESFWVQKKVFGSKKKFLGPKKSLVPNKFLNPKKIGSNKFWVPKIFQ